MIQLCFCLLTWSFSFFSVWRRNRTCIWQERDERLERRCQFHQHFTNSFLCIRRCFLQLFFHLQFGFVNFCWKNICAKAVYKTLIKLTEGLVVKRQIVLSLNQWTRQLIRDDKLSDVKKSCHPNLAKILFCEEFDQKQFDLDVETLIKLVSEEL